MRAFVIGIGNSLYAPIAMSIQKAAKGLIRKGSEVTDGVLNRIEMAFRAYDPCFGCATHAFTGKQPLEVRIFDSSGQLLQKVTRT